MLPFRNMCIFLHHFGVYLVSHHKILYNRDMESKQSAIAKNKIIILYILKQAEIKLSDTRLLDIANTLNLMDYFDMNSALHDMVENHLLDQSQSLNGTFYQISDVGESTLEFFEKELLASARSKIKEYCQRNKDELRLDSHLYAEYNRVSDHQYRVTLKLLENDISIFELSFFAGSKEEAAKYVAGWRKNAMSIYQRTFEQLLTDER